VVVVTDQNVADLYGARMEKSLQGTGTKVYDWVLPVGEESKSLRQAEVLYDYLASLGLDRQGAIVALGGGVVGDLAGFVASTWKRGISYLYFPTTLLAAVDASVGGKTGLNYIGIKNCVGTFYPPSAVVIDVDTLGTLDKRGISTGMAESIKHGMVADQQFLDWQTQHASEVFDRVSPVLQELISRNIDIKARIVELDETELTGERARLNFGHTVGHALESVSGYQLTHGEAVSLGMMAAMYIAQDRKMIDAGEIEIVRNLLEVCSLPVKLQPSFDLERASTLMQADKKTIDERLHFVLPSGIGEVTVGNEVTREEIQQAFERLLTN